MRIGQGGKKQDGIRKEGGIWMKENKVLRLDEGSAEAFCRQGYANAILDEIIAFAKDNQIKRLWLNSSEQGEELYGRRGFAKKENEMELFLPLPGYTLA